MPWNETARTLRSISTRSGVTMRRCSSLAMGQQPSVLALGGRHGGRRSGRRRLGLGRRRGALLLGGAAHLLALGDGLLDRADHVERLLGQLVVLALEDLLE